MDAMEPVGVSIQRPVWGVSALLLACADALSARFAAVAVRGELSGFSRAASGHMYFALKDGQGGAGLLRCAMFRRAGALVDFVPADGQQVELRGRLAIYEQRGELQFVVEAMRRVGAGTLYEEFMRLKARLEGAGLFDAARKRRIAAFPGRIGVVTSTGAAALRDVLTTLQRRAPHVGVVIYPSLVQGVDAPAALALALQTASERKEVDTVLLVRGGGSLEDLWAFNDERVVRAVVACNVPVICGVGHETDITLADLAADLRAPTPTAAAELAAPDAAQALSRLAALARAMHSRTRNRLDSQQQRLDGYVARLGAPSRLLSAQQMRMEHLARRSQLAMRQQCWAHAAEQTRAQHRITQAGRALLGGHQQRLEGLRGRIEALDPKRVLARGYAWVTGEDGRAVISASGVQVTQRVDLTWSDGSASAQVRAVALHPQVEPEAAAPASANARKRTRGEA